MDKIWEYEVAIYKKGMYWMPFDIKICMAYMYYKISIVIPSLEWLFWDYLEEEPVIFDYLEANLK